MSGEVKRTDIRWWIVRASEDDNGQLAPHGRFMRSGDPTIEVVLASDYDAVMRERDNLRHLLSGARRSAENWHEIYDSEHARREKAERHALACRNESDAVKADRDRYKAMVERVKAHVLCVYGTLARSHLNDVLSELPGTRCRHCNAEFECLDALAHGFGRCVERRKIERRQYRACVHARHSPLTIPTIRCNETTRKRDRRA